MGWFRERFQTAFVISGKPQRDVIWEYPLDAVREGIVNAICHRDYRANITIQVRLYDDQLEIWNPGGLMPPLTPKDLFRKHDSIPRNRLLAQCMFYCGLIESWGTGTNRIVNELLLAGLKAPEFNVESGGRFRLIFHSKTLSPKSVVQLPGLNEKQLQAIEVVRTKGSITNRQYQTHFSVSSRTATYDLHGLVHQKILIKHGITGRSVYYTLSRNSKHTINTQ